MCTQSKFIAPGTWPFFNAVTLLPSYSCGALASQTIVLSSFILFKTSHISAMTSLLNSALNFET